MSQLDARSDALLAVLGGPKSFDEPLHVNRPSVGDRERFLASVDDILDRNWFTNDGPYVQELERQLKCELGVRHCIVVSSGTAGLMLAARACGMSGEVLVPSFTFVATAHALAWQGIAPVFCDIDPVTWNIDPSDCERALTSATGGIIGVHLFGEPCDSDRLLAVARERGVPVIFDAAHAFACTDRGRFVAGLGDASVLSFHATKVFHTFEGGAVVTNDDEIADSVRQLRNFGFRDVDEVSSLGTNAKMPEVCAAMGLANLATIGTTIETNRHVHSVYERSLAGIPGLELRVSAPDDRRNWHYVVVEVCEKQLGLSRDAIIRLLNLDNVMARRYFFPGCHGLEPYRTTDPLAGDHLPVTVDAASRVLVLPGGTSVTVDEAERVCDILRTAADRSEEIRLVLELDGADPNP